MQQPPATYKPINTALLGGEKFKGGFDIFFKTKTSSEEKYVKFADKNPEDLSKVHKLLVSEVLAETLYIKEEDLFQFYEQATVNLRSMVLDSKITVEKKVEKVYDVSKSIMKDFFESNMSPNILAHSEQVMEVMESCMQQKDVGFGGLSQILNKDYYTYTHSVNVSLYSMTFGFKFKMSAGDVRELGLGGMLHDVGKSKIPRELINKNGKLTDEEFELMKAHTTLGAQLLEEQKCYGKKVVDMAGHHHEKFDGTGYPRGLTGKDISFFGRICKVMDVYDALTTRRSYKAAMKPGDALNLMKKQMGGDFDPLILDKFIIFLGTSSWKKD